MVYEIQVNIPDTAMVIIHITMFHEKIFEPSSGGIGSKLNNARKLFTLKPTWDRKYKYTIKLTLLDVIRGWIDIIIPKNINANTMLTSGPAMDILPFCSSEI